MKLSQRFPKYELFNPLVPVRCVTPHRRGCLHRFFDTSPISPSGRYLAVFELPFEDRAPSPGEAGRVVVVDLESGDDKVVAETCGWEPQLGANINWGGSDRELFFNDVDTTTWRPFAWKLDPSTGHRERMEGTVYHASPDGKWLTSSDLTKTRKTQSGYGVRVPDQTVRQNIGAVEDDGFFLTDTSTGKRKLLVSIADLLTKAHPAVLMDDPTRYEIYGFHSKFNPQGDRVMMSLRWFPVQERSVFEMFKADYFAVRYAWLTMPTLGGRISCAAGPEHWEKGGHHATWMPDGERISANLKIDGGVMRLVMFNADGSAGVRKLLDHAVGSGHPTVHRDGRFLITDSYVWEPMAYRDGSVPLRWIDLKTGDERVAVRIHAKQPYEDVVLRVDPHPAWDAAGRYVTFNGYVDGTRRVFLADMSGLLSPAHDR